jgi:hypothetical protein
MHLDLATGIVRGVHGSAPRRLGPVNQGVVPIALDEAALSPLVQLGIPALSTTAMAHGACRGSIGDDQPMVAKMMAGCGGWR